MNDLVISAEQAVLGALFINPDKAVPIVVNSLHAEMFQHVLHRDIYTVCLEHYREFGVIDPIPVVEAVSDKHSEEDVKVVVATVVAQVPGTHNLPVYIETMWKNYKVCRVKKVCEEVLLSGVTIDGVDERLELISAEVGALLRERKEQRLFHIKDVVLKHYQRMFDKETLEGTTKTGIGIIDQIIQRLFPSDLVVLAAKPGIGKSIMAANLATNIAEQEKRVGLYSLEMGDEQIYNRLIARHGRINLTAIVNKDIDNRAGDAARAASKLSDLPLHLDCSGYQTVEQIRADCQLYGFDVVIIDYLQLMEEPGRHNSANEKVSRITRGLKILAQDLGVTVILLSQLNRGVDEKTKPELHHLRDSGSIEQDANMVWFMWLNGEQRSDSASKEIAFSVSKNRNGKCGECVLLLHGGTMRFDETDKEPIKSTKKDDWD